MDETSSIDILNENKTENINNNNNNIEKKNKSFEYLIDIFNPIDSISTIHAKIDLNDSNNNTIKEINLNKHKSNDDLETIDIHLNNSKNVNKSNDSEMILSLNEDVNNNRMSVSKNQSCNLDQANTMPSTSISSSSAASSSSSSSSTGSPSSNFNDFMSNEPARAEKEDIFHRSNRNYTDENNNNLNEANIKTEDCNMMSNNNKRKFNSLDESNEPSLYTKYIKTESNIDLDLSSNSNNNNTALFKTSMSNEPVYTNLNDNDYINCKNEPNESEFSDLLSELNADEQLTTSNNNKYDNISAGVSKKMSNQQQQQQLMQNSKVSNYDLAVDNNNQFTLILTCRNYSNSNDQSVNRIMDIDCKNIVIESASESVYAFLKFNKDEMLEKSVSQFIHPNDYAKFTNTFLTKLNNTGSNSQSNTPGTNKQTNIATKLKPFQCQMLTNTKTNDIDMNNNVSPNMLKTTQQYETMTATPSQPKSLNSKNASILFTFKLNKQSSKANASTPSSLTISTSMPPGASSQISPFSANVFTSSIYDAINMDQFTTKMSRKGQILWIDPTNLKSSFNNNNQSNPSFAGKGGLLIDIRNSKNFNIVDYVHNNDLNHIHKHLTDVCNKGENTSAIYRLKVSEKYAFVQTNSKLVPYIVGENEEPFDLPENEKQIILSSHSIIKEIDTEVEMKGNASTSLMKTLISKKPSSGKPSAVNTPISPTQNQIDPLFNSSNSNSTSKQTQKGKNGHTNTQLSFDESQKPQLVSPTLNRQTSSPIGTKFALTMLGLTPSTTLHQKVQGLSECSSKSIDEGFMTQGDDISLYNNGQRNAPNMNKSPKSPSALFNYSHSPKNHSIGDVYMQQELNKQHETLSRTSSVNDTEFSALLSRQESSGVDLNSPHSNPFDKSQEKELRDALMASMPSKKLPSSRAMNNAQTNSANGSTSKAKTKDDIILRALLNTSDLEPQILQLESVFELNNEEKLQNSLGNNQNKPPSQNFLPTGYNPNPAQLNPSLIKSKSLNEPNLNSDEPAQYMDEISELEQGQKSKYKRKKQPKTPDKPKAAKTTIKKRGSQQNMLFSDLNNPKNEPNEFNFSMNNPNSDFKLNSKEMNKSFMKPLLNNDDIQTIGALNSNIESVFDQKSHNKLNEMSYQNNTPELSHLLKKREEKLSTSSSPSMSSASSLSPSNTAVLSNNSNLINQKSIDFPQIQSLDSSYFNPQSQASTVGLKSNIQYLNSTNDLLEDFHIASTGSSGVPIQAENNMQYQATLNTPNFAANPVQHLTVVNDEEEDMLNQIEQAFNMQQTTDLDSSSYNQQLAKQNQPVDPALYNQNVNMPLKPAYHANMAYSSTNNLYKLEASTPVPPKAQFLPPNALNSPYQASLIPNSNETGLVKLNAASLVKPNVANSPSSNLNQRMRNNSGNEFAKDDDITKQKRIEAITKHLKTDLIESFKSVAAFSPAKPNFVSNSSGNNEPIEFISSPNTNPNRLPTYIPNQNVSDESFLLSPQSANNQLLVDENNVPNLTIDSSGYPFQQNTQLLNNNRMRTNSFNNNNASKNLSSLVSGGGARRNSNTNLAFNNNSNSPSAVAAAAAAAAAAANNSTANATVLKKLQEHIHRNAAASTPATQPPQIAQINPTATTTGANVAVVSPVMSTQQSMYSSDPMQRKMGPNPTNEMMYQQPPPQQYKQQQQQSYMNNQQQQQHMMMSQPGQTAPATTTTTVTVTTQHYPIANPSLPIATSSTISMHSNPSQYHQPSVMHQIPQPSQKMYPPANTKPYMGMNSQQQATPLNTAQAQYANNSNTSGFYPQPNMMMKSSEDVNGKQRQGEMIKKQLNKRITNSNVKPDPNNSMFMNSGGDVYVSGSPVAPVMNQNANQMVYANQQQTLQPPSMLNQMTNSPPPVLNNNPNHPQPQMMRQNSEYYQPVSYSNSSPANQPFTNANPYFSAQPQPQPNQQFNMQRNNSYQNKYQVRQAAPMMNQSDQIMLDQQQSMPNAGGFMGEEEFDMNFIQLDSIDSSGDMLSVGKMDEQQLVQDESHLNVNYAAYQQTQSNAYQVNTTESMMANQSYYSRQSQYQPPMNSYNQVYSANQQVSPSTNYQQPMMNAANTTMMNNYSTNISINNTTSSMGMMGEDVKGGGLLHQLLLD